NCNKEYSSIHPQHTMCLEDVGDVVDLSQSEKDDLVLQTNDFRAGVSPPAANMRQVVWDEKLAIVASKWARQCSIGHESNSLQRAVPTMPDTFIGQNAAGNYASFALANRAWFDEVKDFRYGVGSIGGEVGHYTQIVNAAVSRMGCGKARCLNRFVHVCNYARGQFSSEITEPYKTGTACADCPDSCTSNQCGKCCNGKVCLNGGTVDLNTCQCSCPAIYTGDNCQTLTCPTTDLKSFCASLNTSLCQYINIVQDCPRRCGLCPSSKFIFLMTNIISS
ncbi:hypothetical protein LOTGIDRAFT_105395, partial [Lottia gigantea]